GRIISVQVKTGRSYFKEDKGTHWLVRIKKTTVAYWRAHSVPVILILVDPKARLCFWSQADSENHLEFDNNFGISVPKSQVLDDRARASLERLAANVSPAGRRLAGLE